MSLLTRGLGGTLIVTRGLGGEPQPPTAGDDPLSAFHAWWEADKTEDAPVSPGADVLTALEVWEKAQ